MRLRYILGSPGSGKSTLCINEIVQQASSNKPTIYIVPEQFSLESERLLTSASKNGVLMHSEVLSFGHLAHRLLAETGDNDVKILDEDGKLLLLRKITNDLIKSDSLIFYGKSTSSNGFIDNLSSLITECVTCSVSPEQLAANTEHFKADNRVLADKLHDLSLIYSRFNENISDRYISKDTLLDILAKRIPFSAMLKGAEVWIDSFTDFTPQEFKVIEALLHTCDRVNIALTITPSEAGSFTLNSLDPYFEAKRSINRINRIAEQLGVVTEPAVILDKNLRHHSAPDLAHLTESYFSGEQYTGECSSVHILSAASTTLELDRAAGEILSLLKSGYHCSDIALMVSSDDYYLPLQTTFKKYGIPFFTDVRRNILHHPLIELVRSVCRLLNSNFATKQVFRLVRSGFTTLTDCEISIAENYCIACGISGNKWFNEWKYIPSPIYRDKLEYLNDIRENIADMLSSIKEIKKGQHTVKSLCTDIYKLIEAFEVKQSLSNMIDNAREINDEDAIRLHTQVWNILCEILNRLVELMGGDTITLSDYAKLLETGVQNATLGLIPSTCDSVTIAQFNRSRLPNVKALFMLGVNEGIVPPYHNDTNLLSDSERAILTEVGCELGGDSLRLINRDRYNIYSYITKPSERLYLSYNSELESGMRSVLISDMVSMLGIDESNIEEISSKVNCIGGIYSDEQAYEMLIKHISSLKPDDELSDLYLAVYSHLCKSKEYSNRLDKIGKWLSYTDSTNESIPPELALQLFFKDGGNMVTGITALQNYARCPYLYFLQNGLKALDRAEFTPNFTDYGTILHTLLKQFSDSVANNAALSWNTLDEFYIKDTVNTLFDNASEQFNAGFFKDSSTNAYIGNRLKSIAVSTIKAFAKNVEGFVPCGYEIGFGTSPHSQLPPLVYELDNNVRLVLEGSIDRVDLFKDDNNETYVKITDYKASGNDGNLFSEKNMYLGIQLQLPLYMEAYTNSLDNIKPGGFFYFKIDNPVFTSTVGDTFSRLISGGAYIGNDNVINALSDVERSKVTSNRSTAFLKLSENGMAAVIDYVNNTIMDIGKKIAGGDIKAYPYKSSASKNACLYCEYSAVCSFELCSNKNNKYRSMDKETVEQLHKNIAAKE
jgi:ATP-dependent helicase/nuclease subunit B